MRKTAIWILVMGLAAAGCASSKPAQKSADETESSKGTVPIPKSKSESYIK